MMSLNLSPVSRQAKASNPSIAPSDVQTAVVEKVALKALSEPQSESHPLMKGLSYSQVDPQSFYQIVSLKPLERNIYQKVKTFAEFYPNATKKDLACLSNDDIKLFYQFFGNWHLDCRGLVLNDLFGIATIKILKEIELFIQKTQKERPFVERWCAFYTCFSFGSIEVFQSRVLNRDSTDEERQAKVSELARVFQANIDLLFSVVLKRIEESKVGGTKIQAKLRAKLYQESIAPQLANLNQLFALYKKCLKLESCDVFLFDTQITHLPLITKSVGGPKHIVANMATLNDYFDLIETCIQFVSEKQKLPQTILKRWNVLSQLHAKLQKEKPAKAIDRAIAFKNELNAMQEWANSYVKESFQKMQDRPEEVYLFVREKFLTEVIYMYLSDLESIMNLSVITVIDPHYKLDYAWVNRAFAALDALIGYFNKDSQDTVKNNPLLEASAMIKVASEPFIQDLYDLFEAILDYRDYSHRYFSSHEKEKTAEILTISKNMLECAQEAYSSLEIQSQDLFTPISDESFIESVIWIVQLHFIIHDLEVGIFKKEELTDEAIFAQVADFMANIYERFSHFFISDRPQEPTVCQTTFTETPDDRLALMQPPLPGVLEERLPAKAPVLHAQVKKVEKAKQNALKTIQAPDEEVSLEDFKKLETEHFRKILATLRKMKYELDHVTGSHHILRKTSRQPIVINKPKDGHLKKGTFKSLMSQVFSE